MGYKGQYNQARRWVTEARNQYQQDRTESRQRFDENVAEAEALRQSVLEQYDKLSDQDKIDFQRAMQANLSQQNQALAARGLSNTSIANNAYSGSARDTAFGLNRIADERLRGRLGYQTGLTADLINLKQAGPTAPSTAYFNATVANLQVATQYKLAQEAAAYQRQGPNKSFSRTLSNYMAPDAVLARAQGAAGMVAGGAMGGGLTPGAPSAFGGLFGNNQPAQPSYNYSPAPATSSGYAAPIPQYGSQTAAMTQTQGMGGQPVYQTNRI